MTPLYSCLNFQQGLRALAAPGWCGRAFSHVSALSDKRHLPCVQVPTLHKPSRCPEVAFPRQPIGARELLQPFPDPLTRRPGHSLCHETNSVTPNSWCAERAGGPALLGASAKPLLGATAICFHPCAARAFLPPWQ